MQASVWRHLGFILGQLKAALRSHGAIVAPSRGHLAAFLRPKMASILSKTAPGEAQQSYKKIGESNNDESNPNINDENKIPKDKDIDRSNINPALSPNKADKDSGNIMLRNVDLF